MLCHCKVSEAGVHRPHVGGIHGRSNDGAYSLVLAGGFEDEVVCYLQWLPLYGNENRKRWQYLKIDAKYSPRQHFLREGMG